MSMESDLGCLHDFQLLLVEEDELAFREFVPLEHVLAGTITSSLGQTYCCFTLVPQSLWTMLNEIFRADSPVE